MMMELTALRTGLGSWSKTEEFTVFLAPEHIESVIPETFGGVKLLRCDVTTQSGDVFTIKLSATELLGRIEQARRL